MRVDGRCGCRHRPHAGQGEELRGEPSFSGFEWPDDMAARFPFRSGRRTPCPRSCGRTPPAACRRLRGTSTPEASNRSTKTIPAPGRSLVLRPETHQAGEHVRGGADGSAPSSSNSVATGLRCGEWARGGPRQAPGQRARGRPRTACRSRPPFQGLAQCPSGRGARVTAGLLEQWRGNAGRRGVGGA